MRTLFVEARKKFPNNPDLSPLDNLPGNLISLAATVQYLGLIPKIKSYLESKNKKIIIKKGAHYNAHILGCNSTAFDLSADTLLLITDGKFHAVNNAIQLQKPIYVYNTDTLEEVTLEEIEAHSKKTKAKQAKFLSSNVIGILVSTKYGQHHNQFSNLKRKIEALNKKCYIFESNNINTQEFENYPNIPIYINTACYGLARDHPKILNFQDILQFLKGY